MSSILAVIHGENARGGVFRDVVEEGGHRYDEWSHAWGTPPPQPLEAYDAVIVFGGAMHADQEEHHPWLVEENAFIQELLERGVPLLGVCLGIQLFAKAEGSRVFEMPEGPEIGWIPVETTPAAADDPVFGVLPERFLAFGWHYYSYDVPPRAVETVVGPRCNQAFRLGDNAWAIQFHAEVTLDTVRMWLDDPEDFPAVPDRDGLWAETQARIGEWNELGRALCGAFLRVAVSARGVAA